MPELPEVETVARGLRKILCSKPKVTKIKFHRANLRYPLPNRRKSQLYGQTIKKVSRRAKYILLETEDCVIISHLGMTGSWREGQEEARIGDHLRGPHDHIQIDFSNGKKMIYRDPRRFGDFDFVKKEKLLLDRRFVHLGPEPFDIDGSYLHKLSRTKKTPVKKFIMNQKVVVGVGNIYAVEALFNARISPLVQAGRLSKAKYEVLVKEIKSVLKVAIQQGGTTISDFVQTEGEMGYFQQSLNVYGRGGEPCTKCGESIKLKVLTGRSTFWCKRCQT